ncbi:MAG: histidine phosphatase family protein [Acetobacteraceae bacterium]|nr:histidine phosphatase family protein [Acetobacteraceae bacterium]
MPNEPAISKTPFWYLRHGETDWNREGLSQGNADIPLNDLGLLQAKEAALRLRNRGITSIVASPLSRARVTAEIVAEALGLEVIIEPDLREVSWGVHEGQPLAEWFPAWIAGHATPEGAESFDILRRRVVGGLNRAISQPPAVLVVAHGAVFRALRSAMKLEMSGRTRNCVPMWCEPPGPADEAWSLAIHD